jgi:hypothetical protein
MFKITPPQTTSFQISNDKMIESTFSQIIKSHPASFWNPDSFLKGEEAKPFRTIACISPGTSGKQKPPRARLSL